MQIHFAAISRGSKYSPNHVGNDAKILQLTISQLQQKGHSVTVYDEDEISGSSLNTSVVFNMIRGTKSLQVLQELEAGGTMVINTTDGILNCYRENLACILPAAGIPVPEGIVAETDRECPDVPFAGNPFSVWVKRGDVHAIHREDVTLVHSRDELSSVLREYSRRGIRSAVIQQHIPGPVVKFYAVKGTPFFHAYFHDPAQKIPFDANRLKAIANHCAQALNVDIYGGDAVVTPEGDIQIIDLNDWPSFAPVRDEAAVHIADIIEKKALGHLKTQTSASGRLRPEKQTQNFDHSQKTGFQA